MLEQALDVRALLLALRRRWRIVAIGVALGVLAAVAVVRLPSPAVAANARVLIPLPAREPRPGAQPMQTQVAIIKSSLIAAEVASALPAGRTEEWVSKRVKARAVGDQIIAITAIGESAVDAANLANLVASRYVAFASGRTDSDTEVRVTTLRKRAKELQDQIAELDGDIGGLNAQLSVAEKNSPEAATLTGTVEGLRSQRGELATDLSSVRTRIDEAELERQLTRQSLQILEPADPSRAKDTRRDGSLAGVMLMLGAGLGSGLAIAREHRARRVRTRNAMAAVTGAPVLAATTSGGRRLSDVCCELAQSGAVNEPALARELTALLPGRAADGGPAPMVVVIGAPLDDAAIVVAFKLAALTADLGGHTLLLEAARGRHSFASLLEPVTASAQPKVRAGLEIGAAPETAPTAHRRAAGRLSGLVTERVLSHFDAVIVYLPLDGRPDPPVVVDLDSHTVLAVTAGALSERTMRAMAEQTSGWGVPFTGAVVVDPDPADETSGRLERTWITDAIGGERWRSLHEGGSASGFDSPAGAPPGPPAAHRNGTSPGRNGPAVPAPPAVAPREVHA